MSRKIVSKLRQANILLHRYSYTNPPMEIVYRELFLKEIARANVADVFYPVGGAANHSLMYIVAKIMNDFDIQNIIELGAGQTSILRDRMSKANRRECQIRTIEHDASWAERIGSQVEHPILHAPLRRTVTDGVNISCYDPNSIIIGENIELAIVDAPPASNPESRAARLGVFDLLKNSLCADCIIIIDDWKRSSEMRLTAVFEEEFQRRQVDYIMNTLRANKSQAILAVGKFKHAAYL